MNDIILSDCKFTVFIIEIKCNLYKCALYENGYNNNHITHTVKVNNGKKYVTVYIDKINILRFTKINNKYHFNEYRNNEIDIVKHNLIDTVISDAYNYTMSK